MVKATLPIASIVCRCRNDQLAWLIVCFTYALSGASALIYEITWARMLQHFFGATVYAVSANLAIFMAGLAFGAYIGGRIGERYPSLKVYACLQLAICLSALTTPYIFSDDRLGQAIASIGLAGSPALFYASGFVLAAIALIVPSTLIGATASVLAGFVKTTSAKVAQDLSFLYAFNTCGAVVGIACAGFFYLPNFGLTGSIVVAAGFNLISLLGALAGQKIISCDQTKATALQENSAELKIDNSSVTRRWLTIILALSGSISMILQVTWSRLFALVIGSSTYSFSIVLLAYLLGLFFGAWLSVLLLAKIKMPLKALALTHLAVGLLVYIGTFTFVQLPWLCIYGQQIANQFEPNSFESAIFVRFLLILPYIFLPACFLGAVMPLAFACIAGRKNDLKMTVAWLYAGNTCGAVIGSLAAGFVLIPYLSSILSSGLESVCIFSAWCEIALAGIIFFFCRQAKENQILVATSSILVCLALLAAMIIYRPFWNPALISSGASIYSSAGFKNISYKQFLKAIGIVDERQLPANLLYYRDGLNSTITVSKDQLANLIYLKTNGKVDAQLPYDPDKPAPESELITNVLLAELPTLLHVGSVQKALVIGYGSGTTCGSLLNCPQVNNLVVAELEPAVVAADPYFQKSNGRPLRSDFVTSGRVKLVIEDGRTYLSTNDNLYDVIVSQAEESWVSGVSDLYTNEFFRLVRSRLAPQGMFCQWIQLYAITPEYLGVVCRTFQKVFPNTYVFYPQNSGEIILLGSVEPWKIDSVQLKLRLQNTNVKADLSRIGINTDADIMALTAQTPEQFAKFCQRLGNITCDRRIMTDDNLLTEFQLPKQLYTFSGIVPENLQEIKGSTK